MKYIKLFENFDNYCLSDIFPNKCVYNNTNLDKFYLYADTNNLSIDDAIDSLNTINIDIDKLTPTKYYLSKSKVDNVIKNDFDGEELPFIIKENNIYYIIDGHHRITYYKIHNISNIKVKIFDNDSF